MVRNKDNKVEQCLPPSFIGFTPSCLSHLPPLGREGVGEWWLWSAYYSSSLMLLPPHTSVLLQCGSYLWNAVLHEVLHMSCLHRLSRKPALV